jgi:peptide/nickel transport system ATP-binding protein
MNQEQNGVLLDVSDLKMYFPVTRGLLRRKVADVKAVDGVSFKLKKDETLGLVGESGCGKTTIGRCVIGLYRPTAGKVMFQDNDIASLPEKKLRNIRRSMALIFQDPYSSLDPRQSAGSIVGEPLKIHHMVFTRGEYRDRIEQLFRIVGLDPAMSDRFPHEFSGGQRQRIGVARALACDPALIVCDEPISALDVSIQAQILNLLDGLKKRLGLSLIFISHDLAVVKYVADLIFVMYRGKIMEKAPASRLFSHTAHPYSKALISAIPQPILTKQKQRIILEGDVTTPVGAVSGCCFRERCYMAREICARVEPPFKKMAAGHYSSCHFAEQVQSSYHHKNVDR